MNNVEIINALESIIANGECGYSEPIALYETIIKILEKQIGCNCPCCMGGAELD